MTSVIFSALCSAIASQNGTLQVFDWNGSWLQIGMNVEGNLGVDQFGRSVAISADGTRVVGGAPGSDTPGTGDSRGSAKVFSIP